jgi:hypothetical protein
MSVHEPSSLKVLVTVAVGNLFGRIYKTAVEGLDLKGSERVLDFGSGAGHRPDSWPANWARVAASSHAWTSPGCGSRPRKDA